MTFDTGDDGTPRQPMTTTTTPRPLEVETPAQQGGTNYDTEDYYDGSGNFANLSMPERMYNETANATLTGFIAPEINALNFYFATVGALVMLLVVFVILYTCERRTTLAKKRLLVKGVAFDRLSISPEAVGYCSLPPGRYQALRDCETAYHYYKGKSEEQKAINNQLFKANEVLRRLLVDGFGVLIDHEGIFDPHAHVPVDPEELRQLCEDYSKKVIENVEMKERITHLKKLVAVHGMKSAGTGILNENYGLKTFKGGACGNQKDLEQGDRVKRNGSLPARGKLPLPQDQLELHQRSNTYDTVELNSTDESELGEKPKNTDYRG